MPVFKYRSFEDAERALWLPTGDPRLAKRIRSLWRAGWEMVGRYVPPRGLFKFRSIEEANAHRRSWEDDRIARIQRQRNQGRIGVIAVDAETRD